ncbi:MAG: reverse transcriptase family protein [Rhodomicrobium sp.]
MDAELWIARNLATAWLATEWTRTRLLAEAQKLLGPATRLPQRILVRELLACAPASYPPSLDWIVAFLLESAWFREASARVAQKPASVQPILQPAKFAPAKQFATLAIPRIATPGDLSKWLNISLEHLDWFADTRHFNRKPANPIFQHYNYRFIAKRHGPPRLAEEPKPRLKAIQRLILHEILDLAPVHPSVHGFVKKRSCLSAAQIHSGEFIVAALDLRDFFLRTQVSRVHAVFRRLGYPSAVSFLLTGLCINSAPDSVFQTISDDKWHDRETRALYLAPHLPQGAPASPALSNFAAWRMDCRLQGLARRFEANYTRYADDLTFSGDKAFAGRLDAFLSGVKAILTDEGFALNGRKTRIMRRAKSQRVIGITVNDHLNVPREAYDELKAILHNCRKHGPENENRANHPAFRAHLDGRVTWVENVNPARGEKLRNVFRDIKWQSGAMNDKEP